MNSRIKTRSQAKNQNIQSEVNQTQVPSTSVPTVQEDVQTTNNVAITQSLELIIKKLSSLEDNNSLLNEKIKLLEK